MIGIGSGSESATMGRLLARADQVTAAVQLRHGSVTATNEGGQGATEIRGMVLHGAGIRKDGLSDFLCADARVASCGSTG